MKQDTNPMVVAVARITAAERRHRDNADRAWRVDHDIIRAVREQALSDGLAHARDLIAAAVHDTDPTPPETSRESD